MGSVKVLAVVTRWLQWLWRKLPVGQGLPSHQIITNMIKLLWPYNCNVIACSSWQIQTSLQVVAQRRLALAALSCQTATWYEYHVIKYIYKPFIRYIMNTQRILECFMLFTIHEGQYVQTAMYNTSESHQSPVFSTNQTDATYRFHRWKLKE